MMDDEARQVEQWIRRQRELDERDYPGLHARLDAMKARGFQGIRWAEEPCEAAQQRRLAALREQWADRTDR